ncbi:hypothetical protein AVEN_254909-1 [Araneus ventricosus]|uniref:Uncharacterized protein n=1 Tax=Araneus ventricosus TaxID=182803 RepID=A0A4Y2RQK4_ARAVE|nr:hypothetical protein AVEN_254909-1 [Araneus ventricosus]
MQEYLLLITDLGLTLSLKLFVFTVTCVFFFFLGKNKIQVRGRLSLKVKSGKSDAAFLGIRNNRSWGCGECQKPSEMEVSEIIGILASTGEPLHKWVLGRETAF